MRRIKSAPANIAEMVNRKKEYSIKSNNILNNKNNILNNKNNILSNKNNNNILSNKNNILSNKNNILNNKNNILNNNSINKQKYGNIKTLNTNTERVTNVLNDVFVDIFSLSFEETAILGIILNLINNIFRKNKLKDISAILIQNGIKYFLMYNIHHYIFNDYIEKHGSIPIIHLLN